MKEHSFQLLKNLLLSPKTKEQMKESAKLPEAEIQKMLSIFRRAGIAKKKLNKWYLHFNEKTIKWLSALSIKEKERFFKEENLLKEHIESFKKVLHNLDFVKSLLLLPLSKENFALIIVEDGMRSPLYMKILSNALPPYLHLFSESTSSFLQTLKTSFGEKIIKDAKILMGEEEFWYLAFKAVWHEV